MGEAKKLAANDMLAWNNFKEIDKKLVNDKENGRGKHTLRREGDREIETTLMSFSKETEIFEK